MIIRKKDIVTREEVKYYKEMKYTGIVNEREGLTLTRVRPEEALTKRDNVTYLDFSKVTNLTFSVLNGFDPFTLMNAMLGEEFSMRKDYSTGRGYESIPTSNLAFVIYTDQEHPKYPFYFPDNLAVAAPGGRFFRGFKEREWDRDLMFEAIHRFAREAKGLEEISLEALRREGLEVLLPLGYDLRYVDADEVRRIISGGTEWLETKGFRPKFAGVYNGFVFEEGRFFGWSFVTFYSAEKGIVDIFCKPVNKSQLITTSGDLERFNRVSNYLRHALEIKVLMLSLFSLDWCELKP